MSERLSYFFKYTYSGMQACGCIATTLTRYNNVSKTKFKTDNLIKHKYDQSWFKNIWNGLYAKITKIGLEIVEICVGAFKYGTGIARWSY